MVSLLMPYTWLVRVPGLSALREADRLALLGLVGAAPFWPAPRCSGSASTPGR